MRGGKAVLSMLSTGEMIDSPSYLCLHLVKTARQPVFNGFQLRALDPISSLQDWREHTIYTYAADSVISTVIIVESKCPDRVAILNFKAYAEYCDSVKLRSSFIKIDWVHQGTVKQNFLTSYQRTESERMRSGRDDIIPPQLTV